MRAGLENLRSEESLTESQRKDVDLLLQQTRRLTALILDLLLLAQADSGRLILDAEDVNLSRMLESSIDDLEALTFDKSVSITRDIPDEILMRIDERRIRLALQNLIENAAKYTPPSGEISIRTSIENSHVYILISNTGKPIDPEDQSIIFDRFRRGKQVGENIPGHGLGLNIARTLIVAHGGDLELTQSDNLKTEFRLSLPLA